MVFYLHFTKHFMPVLYYLKYINWLFWLSKTSTIRNEMDLSKPVVFKMFMSSSEIVPSCCKKKTNKTTTTKQAVHCNWDTWLWSVQADWWRGRAAPAADDQPTSGHSCGCSLCVSVFLHAAGLPHAGQVSTSDSRRKSATWPVDFVCGTNCLLVAEREFGYWYVSTEVV